jgi:hypothetical protein
VENSDLEQTSGEVDILHAAAGAGRIESMHGGRTGRGPLRRETELSRRVVRIAIEEPISLRETASRAGCSKSYVHKVLNRLLK